MASITDLALLNVWLDVIFVALYIVIVVALSCHLVGNFLTGRMYKRFRQKQWPVHEGPEPRLLPRFLHFQHVACMFGLAFTGMYIRFPFFYGGRTAMRYLHFVFMIVVTVNLFVRLWYAFGSRYRDYKQFRVTKKDITTAPQVVLYYIFVKSSKPHLDKYNVMQKITYIVMAILMFVQAFTGFSLMVSAWPPLTALPPGGAPGLFSPQALMLGWFADFIGGLAAAGAFMRIIHYILNWLFIVLTTIHAYLSVTEDFPAFRFFFGLGGHEDHGAGHEELGGLHHGGPLVDSGVEH